jgi:hypothetical protein
MGMQTPNLDHADPCIEFADILDLTLDQCLPANPDDTPEVLAKRHASARRQFVAFQPMNEADAQAAAMAVIIMLGAADNMARAAKPGVGADTASRPRSNALSAARYYTSTLDKMRKRTQPEAESAASKAQAVEPAEPADKPRPSDFPKIELFQPHDRRGKPIPAWRYDLLSVKQKHAAYDYANRAAWDEAIAEEDAAMAEQEELDAKFPPSEEELSKILPIDPPKPPPSDDTPEQ